MSKVLIVSIIDDDASVRAAVEDLVNSLGFAACAFESAEEFLRSGRVGRTACVITDLQMPGMKGHELQSRLVAQGYHTPMIFITAFPEKSMRERVEAAGAIAFLEKPFDCGKLIAALRDVLRRAGEATPH